MKVREKEALRVAPQFLTAPAMSSVELNFIELRFKKQPKV